VQGAAAEAALHQSESDLGLFTTSIAVQDLDAVRRELGAERIDLVGASYGTRVALEYQRQFPKAVRRSVIDGVAPPDMALPASFSFDNQAAFDALLAACAAEPACARDHPDLHRRFAALLQSLPRTVKAAHPLSGRAEEFVLTRDMLLGAVRSALYVPALAAALPEAIDTASRGEFAGLVGLNATFTSRKATRLATGMHLSVVCAEDVPRLRVNGDKPGRRLRPRVRALLRAALLGVAARRGAGGVLRPGHGGRAGAGAERRHRSGDAAAARRARRPRARADGAPRRRRQRRPRRARHRLRARCRVPLHRCERGSRRARVDAACAAAVPRPPAFRPVTAEGDVSTKLAR
jgi:pimeloyl-ACP methyl ester carboxylesterase